MKKAGKRKQNALCRMALLAYCCMILSGCAAPGADIPSEQATLSGKRFSLSCLCEQFVSDPPDTDSDWFRAFSEKWQADVSLLCIPTLDFVDRFTYLLTTDELPAVVMTNNTLMQTGVVNRALDAGLFWDLEPYLADYPALSAYLGDEAISNARINGKLYGLPRRRALERNSILYRKDWAERLGLAEPRTLEDLYKMIRAFQEDDPDGNGQADTQGLVDCWQSWQNQGWNGIQMLTAIYGGSNGWAFENGGMTPDFLSDAWLDALSFFRRLHHDGLLNEDFSILNAEQRRLAIATGKVGVEFCVMDDLITLTERLHQADPAAELAVLPLLSADETADPRLNSTSGNNGLLLFSRQGLATEEELRFVLSMYNDFCTKEGQDFLLNGIKDIHYTEDAQGKHAVLTDTGSSLLSAQQGDFALLLPIQSYERIGGEAELVELIHSTMSERTPYLVQDASVGLLSDTYLLKKSRLDRIIFDASMRYILEETDEEDYRRACEEWRQAGGNQVIAEYTQQYLALHAEEGETTP